MKGIVAGVFGLLMMAMLLPVGAFAAGEGESNPLLDPTCEQVNQEAPAVFKAKFETTQGDVIIEVHRDWSPEGAKRFYNLVANGFYDDCRFFRVLSGFMAQIGINGDPAVSEKWMRAHIQDDNVIKSNKRGFVTFAKSNAPNSRSTQIFINFGDNAGLDRQGFSPFGQVSEEGMEVIDKLYAAYGEGAPRGGGPSQGSLFQQGNAYLEKDFPKLDYVKKATILEDEEK